MANNVYKDDSIVSVDPREHVRLRPGMYAGDTSNPNQLMMEIFSNALDEHNIGHGNYIMVEIEDDGVCRVLDEGQGFPVVMREDGHSVFEAAFSIMNTSGKYSNDGVYEGTALGLNGIGAKLTNFLSTSLEASTIHDGKAEHLKFKDGILVKREENDTNLSNGTIVSWKPDPQFFDSVLTDKKYFEKFFNDITCLCPNLIIELNKKDISHPNGISDFIDNHLDGNIEITNNRLIIQESNGSNKLDLAMTFCGNSSSRIIPYVNYGLTESGPHITAIKSTITRIVNNWAKENGLLKKGEKNLDGSSIQEGMLLVCNIVSKDVAYNAQVKTAITKIDTSFVTSTLGKALELWLDMNPDAGKAIVEKALLSRKAAEAAKKAREAVKNKSVAPKQKKKFLQMPTTLIDATSKNRKNCELIIVEGLSAASSLVAQRDSSIVGVYSIRGMMLNVQKTAAEKIVTNKEINNLITALGLEFNPKNGKMVYDVSKLRYGKIIACSDADPAGAAIENLLFNILWQLCPELILNGHVYSAEPPLFKVTTNDNKYHFLADQQALNEFTKTHKNIKAVHRAKGLAEQKPEELAEAVLEQNTRKIKQITVSDIEQADKLFVDLYGKDVPPRVKFINENIWGVEVDYE